LRRDYLDDDIDEMEKLPNNSPQTKLNNLIGESYNTYAY